MAFVFVVFAVTTASRGMMSMSVVDGNRGRLVFLSLGRGGVVMVVIFHMFIISMPVSGMVVERVLIYFLFQPLYISCFERLTRGAIRAKDQQNQQQKSIFHKKFL